jgi:hypothetical protein
MFYLSYFGWIFYIAFAGGFWVYPVLEYLNPGQRALFIGACSVLAVCLYMIGEACNYLVWGKEIPEVSTSSQQSVLTNQELKRKRAPKNKNKYY